MLISVSIGRDAGGCAVEVPCGSLMVYIDADKTRTHNSDPLLETFHTSSMQLIRSDEVPPMKRDGILWHSGVGGIRDFGSLIKIHVFFANDTFWNIFKHLTAVVVVRTVVHPRIIGVYVLV